MRLRLPFDSPLPDRPLAKAGVLAMLVAGGLVALLVAAVFAVMLLHVLRGG